MDVARMHDGVVINVEVVTAEWVAANQGVDGYTFEPYVPAEHDRAPARDDVVMVDAAALDALNLTAKQRNSLEPATVELPGPA